jgi:SHS2 domain-containing protein
VGSWEHFEHAADVGVRGIGATPEEAFSQAGLALFALVAAEPGRVGSALEVPLACEAGGIEELLVAYLDELIFLLDTQRVVLGRFELTIEERPPGTWRLSGRAWGERYDPAVHESTVEPKGATYTALSVAERDGRWAAQCVVDV